MFTDSISTLPAFLTYLAVALAIMAGFLFIYVSFTPYREISLIREGNTAAAVSLSGTLIGFALPVANVIENSHNLLDLALWSAIACALQVATYLVTRVALPQIAADIPAGKVAPAVFLAAMSIAVGLINAACMEY